MKTQLPRLIISSYDDLKNPVYAGGGAIAVHEVAKRLKDKFEVTVLTGNYPGAKNEVVDGVSYRRIGTKLFVGSVAQILFHLALPFYVLTLSYDLWVESFTPPFSTSFTPLFTKKPVIGLVHMLSGKDMVRKYHLPFQHIENLGLRLYRHFIVLTEHSALEIRMQNPTADIAVIGNGACVPAVANDPGVGHYLAFLGRIEIDQKGLDLLLAAYAKIREKSSISLRIAGSGSKAELEKLKGLIKRCGLTDSVELVGRVAGEKKDQFLRQAMIGLMPSRYEEFSLVMLEMMAYGVPVAAFDIPGIGWAPEGAIIRVPSFDTDRLADAVVKAVEDVASRKAVAQAARAYAETRSWEATAEEYEKYIEKVLAQNITV